MQRATARIALLNCAFLLTSFPAAAQQDRIASAIDSGGRITLKGSLHPKALPEFDQGPLDPSQKIGYVTLGLKPGPDQQAQLEQLLDDQQNPFSLNYHRWLTPEEFADLFGLGRSDLARVVSWVESRGLHIENVARARNWVAFSGSVQQMQRAFRTEIHRYVINGEAHFANATELSIPAALDGLVGGVRGLDDFFPKPAATVVPQFTTTSGGTELAPADWATIYDVAPLYAMGINGTGQRIAIMGRSDLNTADVAQFRSTFGLPATTIEQHLIGPDPGVTNAASEAGLDVEWSGAIAPNATIVYVYSNNFNDAVQAAVDENLAPIMSESFGTCEEEVAVGGRAMAQQANAQGITFIASAGDSGPADCDPHGFFGTTGGGAASAGLAVGVPASYPEVTAIGGTQFNDAGGNYWNSSNDANGGSAVSYIPEVVWNQTGADGLLASGGGASTYFAKPAWQTGPGVPDDNARDIPDISFSASGFPHDPYIVVQSGRQTSTGGTSAGAPSFAGVVALLNQYLVEKGVLTQPGLGNINPEVYRLARTTTNVFHDITEGNNVVPCIVGTPDCLTGSYGFSAGPGYDLATGLGSVDVYNFVTAWSTPASNTATMLIANPESINLGDTVRLTATVSAISSSTAGPPTGTVTFVSGRTILGTATLDSSGSSSVANLTITGPVLPVGSAAVSATYSGDGNFNGSTGNAMISVISQAPGSVVTISITPNPAHEGQVIKVALTEEAGVATTVTGWTINGINDFGFFATDFGTVNLPAHGTLSTTLVSATGVSFPSDRVYVFTGVDPNGRQWSQQYTLTLVGPLGNPEMTLSGTPAVITQDAAANPFCQWPQVLVVQEHNGLEVTLTRFRAGNTDLTSRIPQLFGSAQLPPFGRLQALMCQPGPGSPVPIIYDLNGVDQIGDPVHTTFTAIFSGPVVGAP